MDGTLWPINGKKNETSKENLLFKKLEIQTHFARLS